MLRAWLAMVFALVAMLSAPHAGATTLTETYSAAGVQTLDASALCAGSTICVYGTETFSNFNGTTTFGTSGANQITGTFQNNYSIHNADQFGGAGGSGKYFTPSDSGTMLTLSTAAGPGTGLTYLGFWWSALDDTNTVDIYDNNTLLAHLGATNLITALGHCPNGGNAYCGNPNSAFLHQDSEEQYAYVSIFSQGGTFNKVKFTGGGFESDNYTVAYFNPVTISNGTTLSGDITNYTSTPADTAPPVTTPDPTPVVVDVPEPASMGLLAMALVWLGAARRRITRIRG